MGSSSCRILEGHMRPCALRNRVFYILIILVLCFSFVPNVFCQETEIRQEYGLRFLRGVDCGHTPDLDYYAVHPRWGWFFHDHWGFELEGHIGRYRFESLDTTSLGLLGLFSYEFDPFPWGSFFLTAGGGILHLDEDKTPGLTDSTIMGLAQAGFGIKLPLGKKSDILLEYRIQHVSDPAESNDAGLNTHCMVLGISFDF
jgi:hypothetical protein